MTPETIYEHASPNGNVEAVVEQDDRVVFFYLRGAPDIDFGVRSCWVRNLVPAPPVLDVSAMRNGMPPVLPRAHCAHPSGALAPDPSQLKLIWFEEGDAAALLEGDEVLAVIPSWSGRDGFNGYARDCTSENTLCWPLPSDDVLRSRMKAAADYWASWNQADNPWSEVQESQLAVYTSQLGPHEKYYGIDGGEWPPRALLRIPVAGGVSLTTVGICLRPQPVVEMATDRPEEYRRIELAAGLASDAVGHFQNLARYISGQAGLPWSAYTWLGPGHTIPCDAFPETEVSAVTLVRDFFGLPRVELPSFRGDPVNLLWMIPITAAERDFAIANGGAELTKRLTNAGVSWLSRPRQSVV